MPAKPSWLLRIPEILKLLADVQAPVVDRATCERLFGVRRRRAIELLQGFGGYRSGNTILVDRAALIRHLQDLQNQPQTIQENARKQRLSDEIDSMRRYSEGARIVIKRTPAVQRFGPWAPPQGISISSGRLVVEFMDPSELLSRLYALAEGILADYEGFFSALATAASATTASEEHAPEGPATIREIEPPASSVPGKTQLLGSIFDMRTPQVMVRIL